MYELQIRKGGNIAYQLWDEQTANFIEEYIDPQEVPFYLNSCVCLEPGLLLKDVFLLLNKEPEIFSMIFGCPFLMELIEEALSSAEASTEIFGLEITRMVDIIDDDELFFYFDFHGVGKKDIYAIELIPINKLINLPLILNEKVSIESKKINFNCKIKFTLREFILSIIEELSFMGPPEMRNMAFDEIKNRAKENQYEDAEDWEKVREKIEKEIEDRKVPCKMCGNNAREQYFDKPSDICVSCFEKMKEN